jgi:hypothetical protein
MRCLAFNVYQAPVSIPPMFKPPKPKGFCIHANDRFQKFHDTQGRMSIAHPKESLMPRVHNVRPQKGEHEKEMKSSTLILTHNNVIPIRIKFLSTSERSAESIVGAIVDKISSVTTHVPAIWGNGVIVLSQVRSITLLHLKKTKNEQGLTSLQRKIAELPSQAILAQVLGPMFQVPPKALRKAISCRTYHVVASIHSQPGTGMQITFPGYLPRGLRARLMDLNGELVRTVVKFNG